MRKELQAELPCHRYSLPTLSIEKENKTMTDYPNNIPAKLEIIKASEVTPKEVRWLWYPYIPFGKVTLLQGDPGDGKSKLMLSLAALLSKGAPLPFADEDESGEPMTVICQTTEDDADDTVVPRFNSAGGDGDRLHIEKEDAELEMIARDGAKRDPSPAKTEKSPLSEPNSRQESRSNGSATGLNSRPSVREKLDDYKVKAAAEREKRSLERAAERTAGAAARLPKTIQKER